MIILGLIREKLIIMLLQHSRAPAPTGPGFDVPLVCPVCKFTIPPIKARSSQLVQKVRPSQPITRLSKIGLDFIYTKHLHVAVERNAWLGSSMLSHGAEDKSDSATVTPFHFIGKQCQPSGSGNLQWRVRGVNHLKKKDRTIRQDCWQTSWEANSCGGATSW